MNDACGGLIDGRRSFKSNCSAGQRRGDGLVDVQVVRGMQFDILVGGSGGDASHGRGDTGSSRHGIDSEGILVEEVDGAASGRGGEEVHVVVGGIAQVDQSARLDGKCVTGHGTVDALRDAGAALQSNGTCRHDS